METTKEIFKITKRQTPKQIVKREALGTLTESVVTGAQIYEVMLRSKDGSTAVSLMTDKTSFDNLKDEKNVIVESTGWWGTLSSDNVKVYAEKSKIKLNSIPIF